MCEISYFKICSRSKHMLIIISNWLSKKLLSFGKIICIFPSFEMVLVFFAYLLCRRYFLYRSVFWILFSLTIWGRAERFIGGMAFCHFLFLVFRHWLFTNRNDRYSRSNMTLNLMSFHDIMLALLGDWFVFLFVETGFLRNNFKKSFLAFRIF